MRSTDDPGNIEYSAVTHPLPVSFNQRGTDGSIPAVHNTRVRPISISTEPGVISV
jgi:hypothetical protein